MTEQEKQEERRTELINDLVAVTTIMEDYWRFHPANEKQLNIVEEYRQLEAIKEKLEEDINQIDA